MCPDSLAGSDGDGSGTEAGAVELTEIALSIAGEITGAFLAWGSFWLGGVGMDPAGNLVLGATYTGSAPAFSAVGGQCSSGVDHSIGELDRACFKLPAGAV
jgi:hypothetical protein